MRGTRPGSLSRAPSQRHRHAGSIMGRTLPPGQTGPRRLALSSERTRGHVGPGTRPVTYSHLSLPPRDRVNRTHPSPLIVLPRPSLHTTRWAVVDERGLAGQGWSRGGHGTSAGECEAPRQVPQAPGQPGAPSQHCPWAPPSLPGPAGGRRVLGTYDRVCLWVRPGGPQWAAAFRG